MLLRFERIAALIAIDMMLHVTVLVGTIRHLVERQVWNLRERRHESETKSECSESARIGGFAFSLDYKSQSLPQGDRAIDRMGVLCFTRRTRFEVREIIERTSGAARVQPTRRTRQKTQQVGF